MRSSGRSKMNGSVCGEDCVVGWMVTGLANIVGDRVAG